jgi:hypothetical protein
MSAVTARNNLDRMWIFIAAAVVAALVVVFVVRQRRNS